MYIHICTHSGEVLCSTLPSNLLNEFLACNKECELKICPIHHVQKRHGKRSIEGGLIYLCSYDSSVTNKIFTRHMTLCESMFDSLIETRNTLKDKEADKIDRLEHNIVTYHKKISEELDEIIPLDDINIKNWRDAISAIKANIVDNTDNVAMSLLHILKDIKLIKAELDVYELFDCENLKLTLESHTIHKVVNLAMQAFWIDFMSQHIKVNIGPCKDDVLIDYTSFSVVLGHIFDNATKYVFENSEININFTRQLSTMLIEIKMVSILVEPDEVDKIFTEKYSGKWSTRSGLSGYGIGMYYAKKLTELNEGTIEFIPGSKKFAYDGIPYAENKIKIILKCI